MAKRKTAVSGGRSKRRTAAARTGRTAKKGSGARKAPAKGTTKTRVAKRKTAARAAASRPAKRAVKKQPPRKQAAKPSSKQSPSRLASVASKVRGAVAGAVAAVAGSMPWSTDENDPIVLLETDHRRFEALLEQGEETTERAAKGRTELLDRLTAELNVHELIEEKILYPALKPHAESRDIVLEGYQEHHVADVLVKELHELTTDDERWGAKFKVLAESLEHHIEEEEGNMFPTAREVLSREELQELGKRMRALKAEAEGRASGT